MKRLVIALLCLLLLPALPLAEEAPAPLALAEIEQFNQALLDKAIKEALPPFESEGGFMVRGEDYEVLLAGEDLSPDSLVISAALLRPGHAGEEGGLAGPRGAKPGMPAAELLELFPNDNPSLAGRQDSAALYVAGELPAAVSVGFLLRDGQNLSLLEYDVYYQAGEGVVRAGLQHTVEAGVVTAIRSFVSMEALSQEAAKEELAKLYDLQESSEYIAYGERGGSRFTREDMSLAGLDFFDSDYEAAVNVLGGTANEEKLENSDGTALLSCQWPGFEAVFSMKGEETRAQRLTINGGAFEGPRGLRLGDTLAQAVSCFEHSGEITPEGGALYGAADTQEPPYGLMVVSPEATLVYYAIAAESGKAGLLLEFVDDLLVSMTLTWL